MAAYEDILEEQFNKLRALAESALDLERLRNGDQQEANDLANFLGHDFDQAVNVLSALFFTSSERIRPEHDEALTARVDAMSAKPPASSGFTLRWAIASSDHITLEARLKAAEAREQRVNT